MTATRHAAKPREPKPAGLDLAQHPLVREVIGAPVIDTVLATFQALEWAEEEIETTQREHPQHTDRLWHASKLLCPTHELMRREFLYRSHVRELLARVLAGGDTRAGTAVECVLACSETSLAASLNAAGGGLYVRMWRLAGLPAIDSDSGHYEAMCASTIDELEAQLRKRLKRDSRRLPRRIEHCPGCPEWHAEGEQLTLSAN